MRDRLDELAAQLREVDAELDRLRRELDRLMVAWHPDLRDLNAELEEMYG